MTDCDIYNSADWYEFTEGNLRKQNRDQMERHLQNCPHCRERYENVDQMDDVLNRAFPPESSQIPDDTEEQIFETAREEARRRSENVRRQTKSSSSKSNFAVKEFLLGVSSAAAILMTCYVLFTEIAPITRNTDTREQPPSPEMVRSEESSEQNRMTSDRSDPSTESRPRAPENPSPSGDPANEEEGKTETFERTSDGPSTDPDPKSVPENRDVLPGSHERLTGDVNRDGNINVVDSMLITKALMNDEFEPDRNVMDINGDGRVTPQDARMIIKQTMNSRVTTNQKKQKTY